MSENSEEKPTYPEINPQKYLESIGPENKKNVSLLTSSLQTVIKELELKGFILAVGGTVEKKDPSERKDVDIRVGFQIEHDTNRSHSMLEMHITQFEKWKEIVQKAVDSIKKTEFAVEIDPPHPSQENESIPANDGMIRLIPQEGGVPIEILCYQEGSFIKPPFVTLFSNVNLEEV